MIHTLVAGLGALGDLPAACRVWKLLDTLDHVTTSTGTAIRHWAVQTFPLQLAAEGLHLCGAAVLVACTAGQGLTVHAGSITGSEGNHVVFKGIGWCAVCLADEATGHVASAAHKALPVSRRCTALDERAVPCSRFGFNTGLTFPGDLNFGTDSVTKDFRTIVWRIKQLGFNAVRLPFTFAHFGEAPVALNGSCLAATVVRYKLALQWLGSITMLQYTVPSAVHGCNHTRAVALNMQCQAAGGYACLPRMQATMRC